MENNGKNHQFCQSPISIFLKKVLFNFEALAASFQSSPKTACECLAVPRPDHRFRSYFWHNTTTGGAGLGGNRPEQVCVRVRPSGPAGGRSSIWSPNGAVRVEGGHAASPRHGGKAASAGKRADAAPAAQAALPM